MPTNHFLEIILEPSCDLHVVLDAAIPRLKLSVFMQILGSWMD
jgi:hypothetical protein